MVKKVILVVMLCVFQIGLSLLLFPVWNRLFTEKEVTHSAEQFLSEAAVPVSESGTESTDPTEPQRPYAELWEEMCAYNDNLYAQKQADLNSTDDFKESSFQLRDYGRKDEVFAVLTIPKINFRYRRTFLPTVCVIFGRHWLIRWWRRRSLPQMM